MLFSTHCGSQVVAAWRIVLLQYSEENHAYMYCGKIALTPS